MMTELLRCFAPCIPVPEDYDALVNTRFIPVRFTIEALIGARDNEKAHHF